MSRWALLALVLALSLGAAPVQAGGDPLPKEFMEIEDCPTEPGCSALYLQSDVTWDNEFARTHMWHHVILKVFTQEGLDAASVKLIKWVGNSDVSDITGRTIRPDGTENKLDPNSAIEETLLKGRGYRQKAVSFQMPGVEIGSIIEYRYKVVFVIGKIGYYTWWVQEEFPVASATMKIRSPSFSIKHVPVSLKGVPFTKSVEDKEWSVLTLRHVPSIREEPFMPPDREARGRVVFRPTTRGFSLRDLRAGFDEELDRYYKRTSKAKKLAKQVLGEAAPDEDKLLRIYRYVQDNFVNTSFRQDTQGEVEGVRNTYMDDCVRSGQGNRWDLTRLFVFLARQGGIQAEVALVSTRDSMFFREEIRSSSDFQEELAAVYLEGGWKFYDPGTPHCPFGMVSWEKEGMGPNALLPAGRTQQVVPSRADDNLRKRVTNIRLTEDGGMTASVELELHGLSASGARNRADHKTPEERRHSLEEDLKELFPGAELEELEYVNLEDSSEPLLLRYRVRADDYATKAGGRLFVPILLYPEQNLFITEDRRHPIYFHRTYREVEESNLELPAGYEVESLPHGRTVDFTALRYRMRIESKDPTHIQARRDLLIDTHLVEASNYELVRELFEEAERIEGQQVVLRAGADSAAGATP